MLDRRAFVASLACAAATAGSAGAQQAYPSREVNFVVPWNAGGANDIIARALQPLLKERGISIIVVNQPGATGVIGLRRIATAAPDGYTIGMGTSSLLGQIAEGKSQLQNSQFTHIARVAMDPMLLLVSGKSPFKTLEDFIAHMKRNPGKVTFAVAGTYNVNHIFSALTARAAGVEYINVPYPGGAKAITDLAGNQVDAAVLKPSETLGQLQEGLVRAIGVFANSRLPQFPDIPTFKERGFDVFPFGPVVQMAYVVAPANLPADVRQKLTAAFSGAVQDQRFKEFAKLNGFVVDDLTGDALAKEADMVAESMKVVIEKLFKN
jgi:tripartite-type tricarboxylate transporter receptor subunit TctC